MPETAKFGGQAQARIHSEVDPWALTSPHVDSGFSVGGGRADCFKVGRSRSQA